MKKTLFVLFSLFVLSGCGGKSPTQSIVDTGTIRIEHAMESVRKTETLEQCQMVSNDALLSAKSDLKTVGEMCIMETDSLKKDLIRWKSYFWGLLGIMIFALYLRIRK